MNKTQYLRCDLTKNMSITYKNDSRLIPALHRFHVLVMMLISHNIIYTVYVVYF